MERNTYQKTREGTVVKIESVELSQQTLTEFLNALLQELNDQDAWERRLELDKREHESTWNPNEEQLSDTIFRWMAYEREDVI